MFIEDNYLRLQSLLIAKKIGESICGKENSIFSEKKLLGKNWSMKINLTMSRELKNGTMEILDIEKLLPGGRMVSRNKKTGKIKNKKIINIRLLKEEVLLNGNWYKIIGKEIQCRR